MDLFDEHRNRIQGLGRGAGSALRVHEALKQRPILSLHEVSRWTGLSFAAAAAGMKRLMDLGIATELTGKKRNRIFGYQQYLAVLAEGTERT